MSFFATFFEMLFQVLAFCILIRAVMSWFPAKPGNQFVAFFHQITEPIIGPLRRIIPPLGGTIDITPMIAFVLLQVASSYAGSLA
ncbi:MAG: YggT family protein [Chloroflexi bacterium]|jgi:YggT family protein|nr:YggT family protein [Chloroflexota bacterium]